LTRTDTRDGREVHNTRYVGDSPCDVTTLAHVTVSRAARTEIEAYDLGASSFERPRERSAHEAR
jgi:hypothetical protein